jgi:hypothetical protein
METWDWFVAIAAFDFGDREPLAELLREESVPPEYAAAVADIVAGKRKPNLKAAAKLRIPAAERMEVAMFQSQAQFMHQRFQHPETVDSMADEAGIEPIAMKRQLEAFKRKVLQADADSLGVSIKTLEDLRREFHERISRWPVV